MNISANSGLPNFGVFPNSQIWRRLCAERDRTESNTHLQPGEHKEITMGQPGPNLVQTLVRRQ
jgi:hypothetical protein